MSEDHVDVLVAGAGAAGLSAALALAQAGFSVCCVGHVDRHVNGRTVALFEGSLRFYRAIGVWGRLAGLSNPIRHLRMIDDTSTGFPVPPLDLAAREIGLEAFGQNIENNRLVDGLAAIAVETPTLSLREGLLADVAFADDKVEAVLHDGSRVSAKLLVAADGRKSLARTKAGIAARLWTYPQVAITALLSHARPHRDMSTEFHTRSGPCTLVPLPAANGAPYRSSLVWLMTPAAGARRKALPADALAEEVGSQVHHLLGAMAIEGGTGFFPMGGLRVSRLVGRRIALIGEAAHAFPPLAAQGLNLSLRDSASLLETLTEARDRGRDIGDPAVLAAFERARRSDVSVRTSGIDVLNRSLLVDFAPMDVVRRAGFLAFAALGPLRRAALREGIVPQATRRGSLTLTRRALN